VFLGRSPLWVSGRSAGEFRVLMVDDRCETDPHATAVARLVDDAGVRVVRSARWLTPQRLPVRCDLVIRSLLSVRQPKTLLLPMQAAGSTGLIEGDIVHSRGPRGFEGLAVRLKLAACDVRALHGVPVAMRRVAAAVDDAEDGLDAEVGVAHRAVAGELRRAAVDVEPVVSRARGDVARQEAVGVSSRPRTRPRGYL
jgi:hypothetical protein